MSATWFRLFSPLGLPCSLSKQPSSQVSRLRGRRATQLPCPLRMHHLTLCCASKGYSFSQIARLPCVRCSGCWCLGDEWTSACGDLWSGTLATQRWLWRSRVTSLRRPPRPYVLFLPWERLGRCDLCWLGDRSTRSSCIPPPGRCALRRLSNLFGSK